MYRTTVIRRALMAAVAVACAAGCTAQAASSTGAATPSSPQSGASGSPSADSKPSGSATPSSSPSASASEATPGKVLMAEGTENEQVRELQARLKQLDHFKRSPTAFYGSMTATAVKKFQGKQGLTTTGTVDESTWQRLVGMTRKPTASELRPPTTYELDTPDQRCMTGRVMCISKESRTLAWMVDGKVVSAMDVRFGSENTPTREGTFNVGWKAREWESTLYHTPMPYAMFFSGGQAVHYSSDFAARGYNGASHGCVNVRDKTKLAALFEEVKVGDKVVVYW
ncbi:L,D-transpeptidase family protein [Streptomyces sp. A3M-1-3]|uniref:L,D-transpeptidase family protein n=1 Tax=Streptomyces sp. A3M-1-3 TaxID=2962044 RepID=UPI0020B78377|nr:L,D-transpeptidase family protein [Streptomyces sp. A3M-1-3]MCP3818933.1 L,D-transpeptidase family protein [Streptomyces sp. A3M-1-3]